VVVAKVKEQGILQQEEVLEQLTQVQVVVVVQVMVEQVKQAVQV
jgi:hypothetical protein